MEALYRQPGETLDYTPDAAVTGGEVTQLADGRAAVIPYDGASGTLSAAVSRGVFRVAKTASIAILNGGRVGLNLNAWRPFAYGGNPFPEGDLQHNYSTTLRYTGELSGDIPEFWGGFHLNWKAALTYNDLSHLPAELRWTGFPPDFYVP